MNGENMTNLGEVQRSEAQLWDDINTYSSLYLEICVRASEYLQCDFIGECSGTAAERLNGAKIICGKMFAYVCLCVCLWSLEQPAPVTQHAQCGSAEPDALDQQHNSSTLISLISFHLKTIHAWHTATHRHTVQTYITHPIENRDSHKQYLHERFKNTKS